MFKMPWEPPSLINDIRHWMGRHYKIIWIVHLLLMMITASLHPICRDVTELWLIALGITISLGLCTFSALWPNRGDKK